MLWRIAYRLLIWCAWPVLWLRLWWRGRKMPALRAHWSQRLGWSPLPRAPYGTWIHAVSAGEVAAAALLARELLRREDSAVIVLTTMTSTGRERAMTLLGNTVLHSYAPYDYPSAVRRFLKRVQPQVAVFIETELWPNTLAACRARGVKTLLANARLSEKSMRRYARLGRFGVRMLANLDLIACQFDAHAERFRRLGISATNLRVTGTLKFDAVSPVEPHDRLERLRANWRLEGRPVWVAGSTHAGEEKIVLDAHRRLLIQLPDCLLLLVPRHPERARDVDLSGSSLNVVWRSEVGESSSAAQTGRAEAARDTSLDGALAADTQVVIGDRMGDLLEFYVLAQLAFVGGSLIARGGQNPIEPVVAGLPVLMGPSNVNFAEVVALLVQAGALQIIDPPARRGVATPAAVAEALASAVHTLLVNPARRESMVVLGRGVIAARAGATQRVADIVARLAAAELRR